MLLGWDVLLLELDKVLVSSYEKWGKNAALMNVKKAYIVILINQSVSENWMWVEIAPQRAFAKMGWIASLCKTPKVLDLFVKNHQVLLEQVVPLLVPKDISVLPLNKIKMFVDEFEQIGLEFYLISR